MKSTPSVAVVGGGLAGLVAARHLAAAGADVTVLERRDEVGGRVRTTVRDGYQFDRGFQVLFTAYPAVKRELDLEELDLRPFAPGAVVARPDGRAVLGDPLRDPTALPSTLTTRAVSVGDRLRVLELLGRLRRTRFDEIFDGSDATIEASLRREGFSERFLENFARPFYGGITLDRSLSTSKRVFEYTFKALAEGEIAVPAGGMGAIPDHLATRARTAGATIELGAEVADVSGDGGSGDGRRSATVDLEGGRAIEVDAVVVATDPRRASDLTGLESAPTAARSCTTQYLSLSDGGGRSLETGRRLVLNATGVGPNHVVAMSEVAPEYAPAGETLLSATYTGIPDASDERLAERTRRALESWFPERSFHRLGHLRTDRIAFAQFAQPPGIHERLPRVRALASAGPIYLAGDYTRWSSIQGALESGRRAARAVVEDLR
ncbi:NAD(P)/FAD-dependent oxidoreductase [Natrialbaceae archaeon GCM10025810]|uniref:NAD(P)/FAD-dependent oxidoreductase n=1 Tax=Halovalidus salilacus TaxID=3075124 RepID=UPI0036114B57